MLKKLKAKTLPGKLFLSLLLIAAGALVFIFLAHGPQSLLLALKGPTDLYSLDVSELEGQYVTADVNAIIDWYAETTSTKDGHTSPTKREYIIPVGDFEFIGMNVPISQVEEAEAVMNSTWAVLDGDAEELDGSTITVTGTVCAMDEETLGYYQEVVGYEDMDAADQAAFLPLVLEVNQVGGASSLSRLICFCLIAVVLWIMSLVVLIHAFTGYYQKQIRNWCKAQADPEAANAALDEFYASTTPNGRLRMDSRFVMCDNGADSWLLETADVVWVYQTTTQHRTNGIPTGKTFAVTVRSKDTKNNTFTIPTKNADATQQLMRDMRTDLPNAVFGYEAAWVSRYNRDPAHFAEDILGSFSAAQQQREAAAQAAAGVAADVTAAQTDAPSAAVAAAQAPAQPTADAVAVADSQPASSSDSVLDARHDYTIILRSSGSRKIEVINAILPLSGLSLVQAKAIADTEYSRFTVHATRSEAEALAEQLKTLGADISLL